MKTLAFLQNQWFKEPEKVRASIERWEKQGRGDSYRRRMIVYALFAGCLTGRRLKAAFGDLTDKIVWEEASTVIADNPRDFHPPDRAHIIRRINEEQPDVIVAFGKANREFIPGILATSVFATTPIIFAPHPAARHATVTNELREAATKLRNLLQ